MQPPSFRMSTPPAFELGLITMVCFENRLAVSVGVGIVEILRVSSGWCFEFECVWFTVLIHILGEFLQPIAFDVEVNY